MLHELTRTFRMRHTTGAVQIAQRGPNHLLRWRMVRPEIAESVRIGLKDNLAAALSHGDAAEVLGRQFGYPYSGQSIKRKRTELGIPSGATTKPPPKLGPRYADLFKKGLSYSEIAEKVAAETEQEVSKKSVENYLLRRGIRRTKKRGGPTASPQCR